MRTRAEIAARLRAAGCVFAEEEAALLLDAGADGLAARVERRIGGEPLESVLGWADFAGLRIVVEPGVFVPRRRSELLVTEACALLSAAAAARPVVVDLCCGSGAVGAAIGARTPTAEVYAADVDPRAVACARQNLPPERVWCGDLFAALPAMLLGAVDVLVVNAPYVPSGAVALLPREARLYEPRAALDGGPDGLDVQRRVAEGAGAWLRPGGTMVVETSRPQAAATRRLCTAAGFTARLVRRETLDSTAVVAVLLWSAAA